VLTGKSISQKFRGYLFLGAQTPLQQGTNLKRPAWMMLCAFSGRNYLILIKGNYFAQRTNVPKFRGHFSFEARSNKDIIEKQE
jgi:hypothetical protein